MTLDKFLQTHGFTRVLYDVGFNDVFVVTDTGAEMGRSEFVVDSKMREFMTSLQHIFYFLQVDEETGTVALFRDRDEVE